MRFNSHFVSALRYGRIRLDRHAFPVLILDDKIVWHRTIMGSRAAKFVDDILHTDRYDRVIRLATITALSLLIIVPIAVVGSVIVIGITDYKEPTSEEWFNTVIELDASRFANIRHYSVQGIDFSHHFKFTFDDAADIDAIISTHILSRSSRASPLQCSSLPDWYTPSSVRHFPFGRRYTTDAGFPDVYSLFVDDQNRVAYFEHVHL